jgi:hypothetical protein
VEAYVPDNETIDRLVDSINKLSIANADLARSSVDAFLRVGELQEENDQRRTSVTSLLGGLSSLTVDEGLTEIDRLKQVESDYDTENAELEEVNTLLTELMESDGLDMSLRDRLVALLLMCEEPRMLDAVLKKVRTR